ncbi:MAG TPA: ABC transporter ATP-binding protein [Terriglobales bacterium]|nr:ABC transporter ATP-binding protein [Terriglobales bacterium]
MSAIQLDSLAFAYDGRPVLAGLSLCVARGERLALLGPNGSGKSTLLKLMSGILTPSAGSVLLEGRRPGAIPRRELARSVAMVPQDFAVPFSFTVREIIELGRTPHLTRWGNYSSLDRRFIDEAVEATGVKDISHRVFNELSGGERRRVMIAMALAQKSEILLLDEPTQQLDISRQGDVLNLIVELNTARGITVVAAMHDLNLAARYFDRVVMLHGRSIAADGTPAAVLEPDFLQNVYGGRLEVRASRDGSSPVVLPILHGPTLEGKPCHPKRSSSA